MKNYVNNFDFFNFVLNNGYNNLELWSQEGKIWLKNYPKAHPFFWKKFEDFGKFRTSFVIFDFFWGAHGFFRTL